MQSKHNQQFVPLVKQLCKEMTKEERHLWYDFLRNYPVRFSRQKVLGKYIADFYSAEAHLVIELDGSQHNAIRMNFRGVCEKIDAAVRQSLSQLR